MRRLLVPLAFLAALPFAPAIAQDAQAPDVLVKGVTQDVIAIVKQDKDIREFYLGFGGGGSGHKSFREAKIYQRRKRWLS